MAKKQTRRSLGVGREEFERFRAFCKEHKIPMSQAASQAIAAVLDGHVGLAPAKPVTQVCAETKMRRGQPLAPEQAALVAPTLRVQGLRGTCAICADEHELLIPTRLELGGPTYRICPGCHGEVPGFRPERPEGGEVRSAA
jgi:hypothetical protein